MATTQNTYTGNNSTTDYSFTFPYIKEADVKVSLDAVVKTQDTDYTFANATTISFGTAPGTGVAIRIFRDTDTENPVTTFFAGSAIRAQDLNDNTNQVLYSAQERVNRDADKTGDTFTGDLVIDDKNLVIQEGSDAVTITAPTLTANRTLTIPDTTGTIVTTGDNGTVTSTMLTDGTIVNADINASAEIAVSKLANGTARQVLQTDIAGTGVEFTSNVDLPGTLDVTGAATFDSTVTATTFSGNATSSSVLTPGRNIGGVAFDGSADINLPGVNAAGNQNTSGNAATATALETARNIAGQSFDGTGDITIAPTDLTGVTSTAAEINQLDGIDLIPTSPTWTSATEIPSNSQISDRIAELGGFEAIADEDSFPATTPPAGVIISIANAGGMVIGASASTTDATRAGGTDPVTIQNIPTNMQSQTIQDGLGMLVIATSTAHTYDFHRVVATNTDVIQLSDDINDFNNRYRHGTSNPSSDNDAGDLFFNTSTDKMLVRNGANNAWEEVQSIGQYFIIPASELADFASGSASTEVISNAPSSAEQIILSINGVIQEPNSGSSAPTDGFALDSSTIRLAATPPASSDVWGVIIGSSVNIGEPSANTVSTAKIQDDAVTYAKMQDIATGNRVLGRASAGEIQEVQVATDMIADDAVTYAKMQHTATANRLLGAAAAGAIGETQVQTDMIANDAVTYAKMQDLGTANRVLGGTATGAISEVQVAAAMIADEAVTEPKLATDAAGSTGQFLQKSGATTMTWATVSTQAFPSGTVMLFNQTAAPTGWTKDTTNNNNSAIRVVTGSVSTGGSDDFTTTFGTSKTTASHTLTLSQIPSHTHSGGGSSTSSSHNGDNSTSATPGNTGAAGGGTGHSHNLSNFDVKFVDVIIATHD